MVETAMKRKPTLDERVFQTIKDNPTATREEIARIMGLDLQRVREMVAILKKKGLLSEVKILVPINKEAKVEVK